MHLDVLTVLLLLVRLTILNILGRVNDFESRVVALLIISHGKNHVIYRLELGWDLAHIAFLRVAIDSLDVIRVRGNRYSG